ncbi:MAG: hypothetical protein KA467_00805 [Bacteroidales bacterium]|nr:hypothetical protein [Bacteroidales bacterium]
MSPTQSTSLRLVTEVGDFTNPIRNYKEVDLEIKRLEKIKESYRSQIMALMDDNQSDTVSFEDYKAERKLVVQKRLDNSKIKAFFGEDLSPIQSETSFVKLTVI